MRPSCRGTHRTAPEHENITIKGPGSGSQQAREGKNPSLWKLYHRSRRAALAIRPQSASRPGRWTAGAWIGRQWLRCAAQRRSWRAARLAKWDLGNRLTAGGWMKTMVSMKQVASNLFVKSGIMGTGKVCPQGWPRRYLASLTPVPAFLKGHTNGTSRTHHTTAAASERS